MVVDTDGYLALIEHLTFNLNLFTSEEGDTGIETVEDVVTDMIASNIMSIFEQNPELHSSVRFKLLKEADLYWQIYPKFLLVCGLEKLLTSKLVF